MARDTSLLGGGDELLFGRGAGRDIATVTGGTARPKVGREVSPFVPRQPQPLPEEKPKEPEPAQAFTPVAVEIVDYLPPIETASGAGTGAGGDAGDTGGGEGP